MNRRTLTPALLLAAAAMAASTALVAQSPAAPPSPAPQAAPGSAPSAPRPTVRQPELDETKRVKAADIDALLAKGEVVVLDVREDAELVETGTVKNAIHIPLGQLESRLGELPKDKVILTACRSGGRASRALALLESKGFKTAGFCGLGDYKGSRVYPKAKA
jgi:rhodanese-related sulfurtransferase